MTYPITATYKNLLAQKKQTWNDFFVYKKQGGELTYAMWILEQRKENNQ